MFHVEKGLYFERVDRDSPDDKGHVRITKRESAFPDSPVVFEVTLDADAWASIISTVSKGNEIDERFYAAQDFHASEGEIEIKKKTVKITKGFGKPIERGDGDENDYLVD